jgi:RNA polymerase sigma-70 factor, ECF subfamily
MRSTGASARSVASELGALPAAGAAGAAGAADPETAEDDPDSQVVAQARGGDTAAFNRLVLRYQDAVYTLCYRLAGNGDDAADAAQEAFLSAYRHLADFRGGAFRSWLLRIAANACHDVHRRRRRRPAESLTQDREEEDSAERDVADGAPGPEAAALSGELGALLQRGLLALPADQRLALVLCDQYGYDYAAIAAITEVELGTVKSRINRARRKLRDFLVSDPIRRELLPDAYRLSPGGTDTADASA